MIKSNSANFLCTPKLLIMILNIHDNLLVEELQERFSECFPHLKIEFYKKPHHWKAASSEDDLIQPKARIGDIRKKHNAGSVEIKSWNTAGEIEARLRHGFGLNVQIFRNENNGWIQTTSTDTCSLKKQSEFSEHARTSIFPKSAKQINEYRFYL